MDGASLYLVIFLCTDHSTILSHKSVTGAFGTCFGASQQQPPNAADVLYNPRREVLKWSAPFLQVQ